VSADFLLGRTLSRDGTTIIEPEELYDISDQKDNTMRGSVLAMLSKKLLVNSVALLFDLLGKVGSRSVIRAASAYLSTAVYNVFRLLHQAPGTNNPDFFSVSRTHFDAGLTGADMTCSQVELADALAHHAADKGAFPDMSNDALARDYPVLYQSLLQIIHNTGARTNKLPGKRDSK
jgi:hypothetical protein